MTGRELIAAAFAGREVPRPPYVPILGDVALALGQVDADTFRSDAHAHARAVVETATSIAADAVTVGFGTDPRIGVEVVPRVRPLLAGRAMAACLAEPDVAAARAYCEAGIDLLFLISPPDLSSTHVRTVAKACAFYSVATILVDGSLPDAATAASAAGLHGAVVSTPTGEEPGIVGGGLSATSFEEGPPRPPRPTRFFWTFAGEVPAEASPEELAALGSRLGGY